MLTVGRGDLVAFYVTAEGHTEWITGIIAHVARNGDLTVESGSHTDWRHEGASRIVCITRTITCAHIISALRPPVGIEEPHL
jgi:hypothetical protein